MKKYGDIADYIYKSNEIKLNLNHILFGKKPFKQND